MDPGHRILVDVLHAVVVVEVLQGLLPRRLRGVPGLGVWASGDDMVADILEHTAGLRTPSGPEKGTSGSTGMPDHRRTDDVPDCLPWAMTVMRSSTVLVLSCFLVLTGCGPVGSPLPTSESTIEVDTTHIDQASRVVDLLPPSGAVPGDANPPLIVLVPGGGWETADPAGMVPLAEALAERGAIVATTTYRAAADGVIFPDQANDVACAVAEAYERARTAGHEPGEVVVVGHSAGAHLGALVTLDPVRFLDGCDHPSVLPGRFIGLAGPYDIEQAGGAADALFGTANPAQGLLSSANPLESVSSRPEVAVLLIHGLADRTVPIVFTESFAGALLTAGHAVAAVYPEGVDHHSVYSSEIADPLIADWLGL